MACSMNFQVQVGVQPNRQAHPYGGYGVSNCVSKSSRSLKFSQSVSPTTLSICCPPSKDALLLRPSNFQVIDKNFPCTYVLVGFCFIFFVRVNFHLSCLICGW